MNPTTVVKAYTELEHERVIEMRHGKGAFVAEATPGLKTRDREKALRRHARQLAIEATQMGAPVGQVLQVVREELETIQGEPIALDPPIGLAALSGR